MCLQGRYGGRGGSGSSLSVPSSTAYAVSDSQDQQQHRAVSLILSCPFLFQFGFVCPVSL